MYSVMHGGLPFSMYAILHAIWTHPPPFCMLYAVEGPMYIAKIRLALWSNISWYHFGDRERQRTHIMLQGTVIPVAATAMLCLT